MISAEVERKEEGVVVVVVEEEEVSRTASPVASMPWKVVNRVPTVSLAGIHLVFS